MQDTEIAHILRLWSQADEQHRDALLQRCLDEMCQNDGRVLDDSDIDMLAAAGEPCLDKNINTQT